MYVWFMFLSHKYFEPRLLINYSLQQIFISQNYFIFMLLYALVQRRQWHPTPVLLPGQSHGQRSLVGCSPWSREKSDTTERLHFHFSLSCIGEGNCNPLQCSCLENPRDGGAWWAAIYGLHRVGHDWRDLAAAAAAECTCFISVQFSSIAQSCPTLCDPKDCSTPGFPVHHQLLELGQTHVHRDGDTIQQSHPLPSPSPLIVILSQHQGLFLWVSSSHPVAKVLEFQLQHQSFQWIVRSGFL